MYTYSIFTTPEEMMQHYKLIQQLNYKFSKKEYRSLLTDMVGNGYKQLGVLHNGECIAIAGYWISTKLYAGKYLELDNVIVDMNKQSNGVGTLLCKKLDEIAISNGCRSAVLDAYVQNERAHRFYFRQSYKIMGFHFHKYLAEK